MGQLGQAVVCRLEGFESEVVYHDARRLDAGTERALAVSYLSLVQLAETSDVVVAALPLTSQTRHLIGASLLQRLRPDLGPGRQARGIRAMANLARQTAPNPDRAAATSDLKTARSMLRRRLAATR